MSNGASDTQAPNGSTKIPGTGRTSNEVRWIDAWTRWERRESISDDEEDEDTVSDQDESKEVFPFHFTTATDGAMDGANDVRIELQGFAMDSQQAWCSTGLTPWQSGRVLCEYLVRHPETLSSSTRILECGSGLGLCGLVAHAILRQQQQQESCVVLTDGDTDTLRQLRANVQRNVTSTTGSTATIACRQLLWGTEPAMEFLQQQQQQQQTQFDVILGADLIYVHAMVERLWETVEKLLSTTNPDACFLMAYCPRETAASDQRRVSLCDILEVAEQKGFVYEKCSEEPAGGERITVHAFRWASPQRS